jgi:hypothetical protein
MNPNQSKSASSAVKSDPYSNKTHRRIDIILILLTLVLLFFAFRYSANSRPNETNNSSDKNAAITQTNR